VGSGRLTSGEIVFAAHNYRIITRSPGPVTGASLCHSGLLEGVQKWDGEGAEGQGLSRVSLSTSRSELGCTTTTVPKNMEKSEKERQHVVVI
jgi:hypothetical protein